MEFSFKYKPESKQRPRFGAKGKVYNPQRKKELGYKWEAATQMRSQDTQGPLECPVFVNLRFHMPMPKSWSKKRKEEQFGKPMASKPDADNLIKWILDVLNGIAYVDDRVISSGYFEKVWDYTGKADISVKPEEANLLSELRNLGDMAVEMHLALQEIYEFSLEVKKMHSSKRFQEFADHLIKKCLLAGMHEIYLAEGEQEC